MTTLGTCTFTNYDSGTNTFSGLVCPDYTGSQRYDTNTLSGTYLPVALQANDGSYYLSKDFYYSSLILFWYIPIGFSILMYLGIKAYKFGRKI